MKVTANVTNRVLKAMEQSLSGNSQFRKDREFLIQIRQDEQTRFVALDGRACLIHRTVSSSFQKQQKPVDLSVTWADFQKAVAANAKNQNQVTVVEWDGTELRFDGHKVPFVTKSPLYMGFFFEVEYDIRSTMPVVDPAYLGAFVRAYRILANDNKAFPTIMVANELAPVMVMMPTSDTVGFIMPRHPWIDMGQKTMAQEIKSKIQTWLDE